MLLSLWRKDSLRLSPMRSWMPGSALEWIGTLRCGQCSPLDTFLLTCSTKSTKDWNLSSHPCLTSVRQIWCSRFWQQPIKWQPSKDVLGTCRWKSEMPKSGSLKDPQEGSEKKKIMMDSFIKIKTCQHQIMLMWIPTYSVPKNYLVTPIETVENHQLYRTYLTKSICHTLHKAKRQF